MKRAKNQASASLRRAMCRAAAIGLCALAASACGESAAPDPAAQAAFLAARVTAELGPGFAPDDVLTTVGTTPITAGELATWLAWYPTLTAEQALQDLIDAHLASAAVLPGPETDDVERDAVAMGRAMHWMAREVWAPPGTVEGSGDPDAILAAPEWSILFGSPELRRASHILFRADAATLEEDRVWAREQARLIMEELEQLPYVYLSDLKAIVDRYEPIAPAHRMSCIYDPHLLFPEVYSGPERWSGLDGVDPAFAAAVFADDMEPGDVTGPVDSGFGVHVILLEAIAPPQLREVEQQRTLAEMVVSSRAVQQRWIEKVGALAESYAMQVNDDAIQVLVQSPEERLQAEQEARGAGFGEAP